MSAIVWTNWVLPSVDRGGGLSKFSLGGIHTVRLCHQGYGENQGDVRAVFDGKRRWFSRLKSRVKVTPQGTCEVSKMSNIELVAKVNTEVTKLRWISIQKWQKIDVWQWRETDKNIGYTQKGKFKV
jgi:hypothetical protein